MDRNETRIEGRDVPFNKKADLTGRLNVLWQSSQRKRLEASSGLEPEYTDLQSAA